MFLQKSEKSSVLDLAIGEPYIMSTYIQNCLPFDLGIKTHDSHWEYPNPQGYKKLTEWLEKAYGAPVIITTGAKSALGASFYAMKKRGKIQLTTRNPYWALLPDLAKFHGIDFYGLPWEHCYPNQELGFLLLVSPNNPDNWMPDPKELKPLLLELQDRKIPVIHDGAYYSYGYVDTEVNLDPIGDLQIFSFSKMLGFPGLRLGYIVCHNTEYYNDLLEYQELITVGVSEASQRLVLDILEFFEEHRNLWDWALLENYKLLSDNRNLLTQVNPRFMLVDSSTGLYPGMFGWLKKGPEFEYTKNLFHVADGKAFGDESKFRMNLSINPELLMKKLRYLI